MYPSGFCNVPERSATWRQLPLIRDPSLPVCILNSTPAFNNIIKSKLINAGSPPTATLLKMWNKSFSVVPSSK